MLHLELPLMTQNQQTSYLNCTDVSTAAQIHLELHFCLELHTKKALRE